MSTDWDSLVGPAVEHELLRQAGARRCYDTDPDFRASLALLAEHLAVVAAVADGQGFPRFSIDDLLRETIRRVVSVRPRDNRAIFDFLTGPEARRFYLNDVCYPASPTPIRPQAPVRGAWDWDGWQHVGDAH